MQKLNGSLLRDGKPVVARGTFDIQEAEEPPHKPIGFRAPAADPPTQEFSYYFDSLPTFKKGDTLRLKLTTGQEADVLVGKVVELTSGLYIAWFTFKSALT